MIQLTMVGASFRPAEAKDIIRYLDIGDVVQLRPEPDNPHDSHAVAVDKDDVHLGYIPKEDNGPIFAALVNGTNLTATIIAWESTLKPVLEIDLAQGEASYDEDAAIE